MAGVNPWKEFVGLLPGGARTIGKVVAVNTTLGISTIEMRDLSTFIARGTSVAVNDNAIVIDGVVVSKAPALPQFNVTI